MTTSIDYAKITEKLVSALGKKIRNYADCQDIAQNILVYALQSYNPAMGSAFETHCFTVMRGKSIDFLRSKSRKGNLVSWDILEANNNSEDPLAQGIEIAEKTSKYNLLEIAEEYCTEQEYFIIQRKLEGFDGYEIANMLGVSPGYVSQQLSRAIEKMKGGFQAEIADRRSIRKADTDEASSP